MNGEKSVICGSAPTRDQIATFRCWVAYREAKEAFRESLELQKSREL
jgi:hypothetical protein